MINLISIRILIFFKVCLDFRLVIIEKKNKKHTDITRNTKAKLAYKKVIERHVLKKYKEQGQVTWDLVNTIDNKKVMKQN